jgi:hypothetical protein
MGDASVCAVPNKYGTFDLWIDNCTPEQAIVATVGERYYAYDEWRAISEAVGDAMEYAHEHAVMYPDKADPLWNIDEYVNRVLEVAYGTKDATVDRCDTMGLWHEWEQVLFANVSDEVAQDNLNECVHDLLDKAATVGRSCASCPEMDNPDSYIMHLHRALEVADRGTGTCKLVIEKRPRHGPWIYHFGCGYDFWQPTDCPMPILKHCPNCGAQIIKEAAE